ncbi:MAG: hypothetical protein ACI9YH_000652 [Colwellia sp.]
MKNEERNNKSSELGKAIKVFVNVCHRWQKSSITLQRVKCELEQ